MQCLLGQVERLRIGRRLMILIALFAASLVMVVGLELRNLNARLIEGKEEQTRRLVEVARGVVASEHARFVAGAVSEEEAKRTALEALSLLRYDGVQYFWVNDSGGTMLMHPTAPDLVGSNLLELEDARGARVFGNMIEIVREHGGGSYRYYWPPTGEPQLKISYVIGFDEWGWTIGSGVFATDVGEVFRAEALKLGLIMVVALTVTAGLSRLIAGTISKPLSAITVVTGRLAEGDTAVEIPCKDRHDEAGDIARALQVFKDNALEQRRLESLERDRVERVDAAIHRFDGEVGVALGAVDQATSQLDGAASSMVSGAGQASSNVQAVAAAAEEMSASVSEISQQTVSSREVTGEAMRSVEAANRVVGALDDTAQQITSIVDLISEIADQTNLLALNATIEAARAGEAGRGFAVVAQEVKTLASRTGQATSEIAAKIGAISEGSDQAVRMIAEVSAVMARIDDIATAIAGAIEEQSATTQSIARNAQEAAQSTENVVETIRGTEDTGRYRGRVSMVHASQSVGEQSQELKARIQSFLDEIRAA